MGARLLAAAAAVALLIVAGCTSDSAPVPSPLPSRSSESGSASPSPAAPTLPATAKGTSPTAAKAFARHFFATVNYAASSGDTVPLRALAAERCISCDAIASNIESVYASGGSIDSQGWSVDVLTLVPRQPRRQPILDVGVTQAPETVVESAGAQPEEFAGGKQPMTLHLRHRAPSRWQVTRLDLVT